MKFATLISTVVVMTVATMPVQAANDPEKIFTEVVELIKAGDTDAALEEAKWGVERLEQIRQDKVSDIFPDDIIGFKGAPLSKNKAMGVSVTERIYSNGEMSVTVSLTEEAGGDSGMLGGLGALVQMSNQFGGGRKVRIQRRTGTAMAEGSSSTVNITLESSGTLMFQSDDMDLDALIEWAEEFPVAKLDEARS